MSAVEEIEAAIAKLTALKMTSRSGPLSVYHLDWRLITVSADSHDGDAPILFDVSRAGSPADGELIVTLHRTIDAQLAILRSAREQLASGSADEPQSITLALMLTWAINGTA